MNVKFQCTKINHKNGINNSINYSVKSSILIPCKKNISAIQCTNKYAKCL